MDGERETVSFLKELLAEKEQPMMCQHPFQHPIESALGFDASVCRHQEAF